MAEALRIETEEQYERIITGLGMEGSPASASALDDLITVLREAVQDQYVEAQARYEEIYGWKGDPETFGDFLDSQYPELAMLPEWVFARIVRDGP